MQSQKHIPKRNAKLCLYDRQIKPLQTGRAHTRNATGEVGHTALRPNLGRLRSWPGVQAGANGPALRVPRHAARRRRGSRACAATVPCGFHAALLWPRPSYVQTHGLAVDALLSARC